MSDSELIGLFQARADAGDAEAQYQLGRLYEWGTRAKVDLAQAEKWYRKAAAQGHAGAKAGLGSCYQRRKDYAEAYKIWLPLAEQGHAEAQSCLGSLYFSGSGVPRDYALAEKWYRAAAEKGHIVGQSALARMYEYGDGLPQDYILAYMWLAITAAAQPGTARFVDTLAKKMSPEQIMEGQRRAAEWIASHPATNPDGTPLPTARVKRSDEDKMLDGPGRDAPVAEFQAWLKALAALDQASDAVKGARSYALGSIAWKTEDAADWRAYVGSFRTTSWSPKNWVSVIRIVQGERELVKRGGGAGFTGVIETRPLEDIYRPLAEGPRGNDLGHWRQWLAHLETLDRESTAVTVFRLQALERIAVRADTVPDYLAALKEMNATFDPGDDYGKARIQLFEEKLAKKKGAAASETGTA